MQETLCNHWNSGHYDEWIPHINHAKAFFSKEYQRKDQVEAIIMQVLNDDILSTIDEASQADEYDDGPIYEDPEFLEPEEQKDRVISPNQHTTFYNISYLSKHNDGNYEDDGYWTFMGPPFYDYWRPGSVVSIRCNKKEQLDEVTQVEPNLTIFGMRNL